MAMSEAAREARKQYKREWYAKNKDKQREYTERYWTRKAAEMAAGDSDTPADAPELVKAG